MKIEGKAGISAKILCDSINEQGNRLTTLEIEYPRIILAEYNTHRMLSRNSSSSRAIPFKKMLESLNGIPVRFGANQSGMQDQGGNHQEKVYGPDIEYRGNIGCAVYAPEEAWEAAKKDAIFWASAFSDAGYHKQICNRLVEPFQMMKTVTSATEWDNFDWLRNHEAADPSLHELARCMQEAKEKSEPRLLKAGEWHLPYVTVSRRTDESMAQEFWLDNEDGVILTLEQAIKVSVARCAAVSFRNEDYGLEKCLQVYDRLVGDDRKHASALEHVATPIDMQLHQGVGKAAMFWEPGISHMDREGNLWSGNFKGWVQYRKTVEGENYVK